MMRDTIFRAATADDCNVIAAVHVTAWHESYSDILPPVAFRKMDLENRTKLWRRRLGEPLPVYVAEFDREIVGFADGGPARADEALDAEMQVYAVYLLNRAKRRGIGTKLLRRVLQQFLALGASSACVWALRDAVPARRFYEHHGAQFAAEKLENRGDYERVVAGYVWRDLRRQFGRLESSDLA
jgi:L-amino acid N-acyltransferase YncA